MREARRGVALFVRTVWLAETIDRYERLFKECRDEDGPAPSFAEEVAETTAGAVGSVIDAAVQAGDLLPTSESNVYRLRPSKRDEGTETTVEVRP